MHLIRCLGAWAVLGAAVPCLSLNLAEVGERPRNEGSSERKQAQDGGGQQSVVGVRGRRTRVLPTTASRGLGGRSEALGKAARQKKYISPVMKQPIYYDVALAEAMANANSFKAEALERQKVNLASCAKTYPDYIEYLDRMFGMRVPDPEDPMKPPDGTSMVFQLEVVNGTVVSECIDDGFGTNFKRQSLKAVMSKFVARNRDLLKPELEALGGGAMLYLRHLNGDCPEDKKDKTGLPLLGYSSDRLHDDISWPDFTFWYYPDIRSRNVNPEWLSEHWEDVTERLHKVKKTKRGFVWRGSASNQVRVNLQRMIGEGPPAHLKPVLDELIPDGFDVQGDFKSLYDQCEYPYTFHMPGKHYSAMLKYKMACNQTIFMVGDGKGIEEFFYPTLRDNVTVYWIDQDLKTLWSVIERAFSQPDSKTKLKAVGDRARQVTDTYLSQEGMDCYMMLYLSQYYFPLLKEARALHFTSTIRRIKQHFQQVKAKGTRSNSTRVNVSALPNVRPI